LFIVPLDSERRWFRYHHLFADLLQQRLRQSLPSSAEDETITEAELHRRASQWYEDNDMDVEAFQHAVAANDVDRAARLLEGGWMPLHFRGAIVPVLKWLELLPQSELDARPLLWVMYASALSMSGQFSAVEDRLQSAEAAIQEAELDVMNRNIIGHIAAIRALLAAAQYQVHDIIKESRRALEYLHPDNLAVRTATIWKMGLAYQLQGDRDAASQAFTETIAICEASGNTIINISATTGLGQVLETENQLHEAAQTYQRVLDMVGEPPSSMADMAFLGLARIAYQWNKLDDARKYGETSAQLAHQIENPDRIAITDIFLAGLKMAQDEIGEATALLAQAEQIVHQHSLMHHIPALTSIQVRHLLRQENLEEATALVEKYKIPICQARVCLAQGDTDAALTILRPFCQQMEASGWQDERLKALVLLVMALDAQGKKDDALQALQKALVLAEPGGCIRIFVDEGPSMKALLSKVRLESLGLGAYVKQLLAAFGQPDQHAAMQPSLVEPLSERELEVLQLIAQGLSNQEISELLFLALSTVKGHNRRIYAKLQVQRRTEAVAHARELGLI
jgi:LuxR family maltose regulon positive regulatory protein